MKTFLLYASLAVWWFVIVYIVTAVRVVVKNTLNDRKKHTR